MEMQRARSVWQLAQQKARAIQMEQKFNEAAASERRMRMERDALAGNITLGKSGVEVSRTPRFAVAASFIFLLSLLIIRVEILMEFVFVVACYQRCPRSSTTWWRDLPVQRSALRLLQHSKRARKPISEPPRKELIRQWGKGR
jgi:hypothetical protein